MSVTNLQTPNGNAAANQFEIRISDRVIFKSYGTIIAIHNTTTGETLVNQDSWDCSQTTLKYFKVWLGTSKSKKELTQYLKNSDRYRLVPHLLITDTYYSLVG